MCNEKNSATNKIHRINVKLNLINRHRKNSIWTKIIYSACVYIRVQNAKINLKYIFGIKTEKYALHLQVTISLLNACQFHDK